MLKDKAKSTLRIRTGRRNARKMQDSFPLCPNCVQPMRLTRRIEADATYHGQEVFECHPCRVAMTEPQAKRAERRAAK